MKTPRTPGVSVQTPAKGKHPMSIPRTGGTVFDDSDEEEDEIEIFSPPKTIQFHIPHSKLLQTPGKSRHMITSDTQLTISQLERPVNAL
jgi:DASH complex subunit ASK1